MSQSTHSSRPRNQMYRGLTNNSTLSTFAVPVPTGTKPVSVDSDTPTSNRLILPVAGDEIQLFPFGTDADNETLNIRVYLWRKMAKRSGDTTDLWVPRFMGGFVCTLSESMNGVAGAPLSATEFLADTITEEATATWDDADTSAPVLVAVRSYANDQLAEIRVKTVGYELVEVAFDLGTGASGNVCYAW